MNPAQAPNLIIAGVTKGGTTSIFTYLGDHPDICGSTKKELRYFMSLRYGKELGNFENYVENFAACTAEKYRMEASPGYIYGGKTVADAIRATLPSPKVLLILREPVGRLHSFFRSHQNKFVIDTRLSFEQYIDQCQKTDLADIGEDNYVMFGVAAGCYSDYLEPWIEIFGDDLQICFFDDFLADQVGFLQSICAKLGIDGSFYDTYTFTVENKSVEYKSLTLQRVAVTLNNWLERFFRQRPQLKRFLRSAYYRLNGQSKQAMDHQARLRLQEYYEPYNAKLKEVLERHGYPSDRVWRY
ncbi:MAG: sulfotransferase [Proteobacteria bacterium]|nr:sulfotransferase [Pseudomonadota bacterium]